MVCLLEDLAVEVMVMVKVHHKTQFILLMELQIVAVGAEELQGELVDSVVPELLYWCRGNR